MAATADKTLFLVCFDVCGIDKADRRRRVRVAKILEGYGERVQKSVFECWLTRSERRELEQRLGKHLKADVDRFECFPLRPTDARRVVVEGKGAVTEVATYKVV